MEKFLKSYGIPALLFLFLLILVNSFLPYPDNNDFYELSRLCLLMDTNIKYAVNNNWGFAHPLSCWLLTQITDDLLIAQRIINGIFSFIFFFCFLKIVYSLRITTSKLHIVVLSFLMISPWILDLLVSAHLDIVPIALVFTGLVIIQNEKPKVHSLVLAGFLVGCSYWFRFHFLAFALLFPFLAFIILKRDKKIVLGHFALPFIGISLSVAIPHVLCEIVFGVFSISNQKFVVAEALGIADWSYEFAVKLRDMTFGEMFRDFNILLFTLKYGYRFFKSGILPFVIIVLIAIYNYSVNSKSKNFNLLKRLFFDTYLFPLAFYAFICVMPFTILRGFTYRLEAAFVLFMFPVIAWCLSECKWNSRLAIIILVLTGTLVHQILYFRMFKGNRDTLVEISQSVKESIPGEVLQNKPQSIICTVDFYNPYNKYRLCNPMVFAGWGVRFKPFRKHFGILNLSDPFENKIYKEAKYVILPTEPGYFDYSEGIIEMNKPIFKGNHIITVRK